MLDRKVSEMNRRSQQYFVSEPQVEEHVDPVLRGRESYADPVSQEYPFWVPGMEESALSLVLGGKEQCPDDPPGPSEVIGRGDRDHSGHLEHCMP